MTMHCFACSTTVDAGNECKKCGNRLFPISSQDTKDPFGDSEPKASSFANATMLSYMKVIAGFGVGMLALVIFMSSKVELGKGSILDPTIKQRKPIVLLDFMSDS